MKIRCKTWDKKTAVRSILAIRLQALGDMFGTLPYLQSVRQQLGQDVTIDFLTRNEVADIPLAIDLFNHVHVLRGQRNEKRQIFWLLMLLPTLFRKRYDVVLDLQNNKVSRLARMLTRAKCWTEFDKFSPVYGGERYRQTINSSGIASIHMYQKLNLINKKLGLEKLTTSGWKNSDTLIVVNPGGAFSTRHWPVENYVALCHQLKERCPSAKFLMLGLSRIYETTAYLKKALADDCIDLTGRTTQSEALSILQYVELLVSEDSGLMHMAYFSGVPTVGILGSTRSDWTNPKFQHTFFFTSDDLPCGNCMQSVCPLGTIECLRRLKPEEVAEKGINLMNVKNSRI